MSQEKQAAKEEILRLVRNYCDEFLLSEQTSDIQEKIPYAGRIFDSCEVTSLVESALEFWLTAGHFTEDFENHFAQYIGVPYCSLVNSGSSALLVAFWALTAAELGERRIQRGDEVITVAAAFPTTVAPILQYGAVPVFVDVSLPGYNLDPDFLEQALSSKTKAVILAHTLGNPFSVAQVKAFCERHSLWLIEDNCDALGAEYTLDGKVGKTGSFGDLACSSFYPPHHITMGEGGAVYTANPLLHRLVRSFRDWGRDCVCPPGIDNACGHRFSKTFGLLPAGYDHKYVYSHLGFNLKATDMQAAIGIKQLEKLPEFVRLRRKNWSFLRHKLEGLQDIFLLPDPELFASPSWFGFVLTLRDGCGFSRREIVNHLEAAGIQTRTLFAGNLLRHPCFDPIRGDETIYRVVGTLKNTDKILSNTFWVGVYPGLTEEALTRIAAALYEATARKVGI